MRHFFVINPHSFGKDTSRIKQIMTEIENCFTGKDKAEYKIHISRYPRDAVASVHRYLITVPPNETARVYAIGGDGTLFDCLNGMVDFPTAELTSVPYGNANDFVRSFGEKAAPAFRDIKKLSTAPSRKIDIINCGSNYALMQVHIGLIGQTVIHANAVFRRVKSNWIRRYTSHVYTFAGMKSIFNKEILYQNYTVTMDGETITGNFTNIHVANGPCDGGSFVPSPYAMPNDGVLDAIFMRSRPSLEIIRVIGDRNKGLFEKHKSFEYRKCHTMHVKSNSPLCIQIDGEAFYDQEFKINIVPGRIKFFAPEGIDFEDYSYRAYKKGNST
jgi:diacylglycerol kinase family enzyme